LQGATPEKFQVPAVPGSCRLRLERPSYANLGQAHDAGVADQRLPADLRNGGPGPLGVGPDRGDLEPATARLVGRDVGPLVTQVPVTRAVRALHVEPVVPDQPETFLHAGVRHLDRGVPVAVLTRDLDTTARRREQGNHDPGEDNRCEQDERERTVLGAPHR
jgi:hypothetical protein